MSPNRDTSFAGCHVFSNVTHEFLGTGVNSTCKGILSVTVPTPVVVVLL